jgi:hypothetical protein
MSTNGDNDTDINASMKEVEDANSSQSVSNYSSSFTTTGLCTTSNTDAERIKKRKRGCMTQKVLSAVVGNGRGMGGVQILSNGLVSRSMAFSIAKKSRNYPLNDPYNKMHPVTDQATVIEMVQSLRYNLVDFPYDDMVLRFCSNACCDIRESLSVDRLAAANARRKRAHRVWAKSLDRFQGREAMNTLMCVLYSPSAVCSLMTASHSDIKERPGHVMVLRFGGAFIVFMTDSVPSTRFPLEWFLHRGDHTSAWIWVNIKDICWDRHRGIASSMVSITDNTNLPAENPCASVQDLEVFGAWSKVNEVTQTGMHVLQFLRVKAQEFAEECGDTDTKTRHIYLRPYHNTSAAKTHPKAGNGPVEVSKKWCTHIEAFVKQFAIPMRSIGDHVNVVTTPIATQEHDVEQVQCDIVNEQHVADVMEQLLTDVATEVTTRDESVCMEDTELCHVSENTIGVESKKDGEERGFDEVSERSVISPLIEPVDVSMNEPDSNNFIRHTHDREQVSKTYSVDVVPSGTGETSMQTSEASIDDHSHQEDSSDVEQIWSPSNEDGFTSLSETVCTHDPWIRVVLSDTDAVV